MTICGQLLSVFLGNVVLYALTATSWNLELELKSGYVVLNTKKAKEASPCENLKLRIIDVTINFKREFEIAHC
jgi:hypothetical protein